MTKLHSLSLTLALLASAGCATYAPPGRLGFLDDGAAMPKSSHELQAVLPIGGPRYSYGLFDNWALQTGIESDFDHSVMGYLGLQPTINLASGFWLAIPFGVGFGKGGEKGDLFVNGGQDPSPWAKTIAGGAGLILGLRKFERISGYLGYRVQYSAAEKLPSTLWQTYSLGCRITFSPQWDLLLEAQVFTYHNSVDEMFVPIGYAGLAYHF